MAAIKSNSEEVKLLARLLRAEAEGEGNQGMLMVGNVGVNRVLGNCIDFKNIRSIQQMVFQSPGGFEATQKGYFYQAARENEIELARRVINGERIWPSSNALWYFRPAGSCPPTWWDQKFVGKFKAHCFYNPKPEECPRVF
ncbi:cell wall hydrolase [Paenibacillus montanisoli]|uniref:Cell wall hydrolase n=1 Tax=Paenibacillus montanisoli TaxID=2081970 RepID=A0A328U1P1_9BACL|nr:cell wall hydrolase [Paenibacillus montanisoli]RAP75361.1 cell wall hydrolase [Paenibacillus montanisoli]